MHSLNETGSFSQGMEMDSLAEAEMGSPNIKLYRKYKKMESLLITGRQQ